MLRGTLVPFLFQYENVVIPVGFVARNDDFLARIESFDYLVGLRVLATDPDSARLKARSPSGEST